FADHFDHYIGNSLNAITGCVWYFVVIGVVAAASVGLELPLYIKHSATGILALLITGGPLLLIILGIDTHTYQDLLVDFILLDLILFLFGLPLIYLLGRYFRQQGAKKKKPPVLHWWDDVLSGFLIVHLAVITGVWIYLFLQRMSYA